ncbi:MAG TPA: O-antigen ligase family protein [Acidobacteriota bacterium]|nr:O-antigen ligase family protein [Acidobacteriota bacterium]HQO20223.1 O-antigen ligase family protein [Acidobacteriota bacterium]HQQ46934.1 O-antigen ligase family protein [Acidobacteriota bacterium]
MPNAELFLFYLYGAGSPLSIFVQNLCLAALFIFCIVKLAAKKIPVNRQLIFFFIFIVTQLVSVFFSADTHAALKGVRDWWALAAGFMAGYGLSPYCVEKLPKFRAFLAIGSLFAAAMAVVEFLFGTNFHKQRLFSKMPIGSDPSTGFFSHHLTFAGFMGIILLFLLAGIIYGERKKIVVAGASAAMLCLLLSQSRGYLLVMILCLPVLLYGSSKRHILKALASAAAILIVVFIVSPRHVKERAFNLFSMKNGSFAERVYLFRSGMEMAAVKPVFGWGPGCYTANSKEFRDKYNDRVVYPHKVGFNTECHTHNSYLMVLVESGIVGLAGYLAFIAVLLLSIIKSGSPSKWGFLAICCYFLLGGLFEYNLGDAEVAGLFAFFAGLARSAERSGADKG